MYIHSKIKDLNVLQPTSRSIRLINSPGLSNQSRYVESNSNI